MIDELKEALEICKQTQLVAYDIETAVLHPKSKTRPSDTRQPLEKIVSFSLTVRCYQKQKN